MDTFLMRATIIIATSAIAMLIYILGINIYSYHTGIKLDKNKCECSESEIKMNKKECVQYSKTIF